MNKKHLTNRESNIFAVQIIRGFGIDPTAYSTDRMVELMNVLIFLKKNVQQIHYIFDVHPEGLWTVAEIDNLYNACHVYLATKNK